MKKNHKTLKLIDTIILILNASISIIIFYILINQPAIKYEFKLIDPLSIYPIIPFIFTAIIILFITYDKKTKYSIKYIISVLPIFTFLLILIQSGNYIEQGIIALVWFTFKKYLLNKINFTIADLYVYGIIISILTLINPIFIFLLISLYLTINFKDVINIRKILAPLIAIFTMSVLIFSIDTIFLDNIIWNHLKLSFINYSFTQIAQHKIGLLILFLTTFIILYPWIQKQIIIVRRETWITITEIIIFLSLIMLLPLNNFSNALMLYVWILLISLQKIILKDISGWNRILYQFILLITSVFWIIIDKI
jgi:hypothetical protein